VIGAVGLAVDDAVATRSMSVLVVDDDPDHRDLITRRLGSSGAHVETASNGDAALAHLSRVGIGVGVGVVGVDVVLLDYKLGGRDGLEVLRAIRSRPYPPSVVMVTGMGSEEVVIECLRAGASDYVIKDRHYLAALPSVVERAWRHHDLERRARELQRLALLVTSAPDRDSALQEVVQGAVSLLGAESCELVLLGASEQARPSMAGAADVHELRLPVTTSETGHIGDLVVRRQGAPYSTEEHQLASTFASFAAIAMGKLHQLELERSLVAELQQTLDVRRQLVAGVSHELRTPLTAISGFAQTLLAHWDRLDEETRIDMVTRVRGNALELTSLVEQLLDFASIEAGRLAVDTTPTELAEVAGSAVADLSPLLADRTVVVSVPADLVAMADATLMRRTLYNLLSNAAKYTPADAAIAVRAYAVDGGDRVRVEVADTGDGMSPEDAARAFEPFWRGDGNRHWQRGTGIGLALVRDYVRLMGGEIGVETARGAGAVFWFTLPTVATAPTA
jgi:signal transduction histidine kinase